MSEPKFTPGPWGVVHDGHEVWVRDTGGLIVIAAVPDLYVALKRYVNAPPLGEGLSLQQCADYDAETLRLAKAALAKARGET